MLILNLATVTAMATARVRQPAPDFTAAAVVDGVFEDISLSTLTSSGKWVVLLFYPMDFTFVCKPSHILNIFETKLIHSLSGPTVWTFHFFESSPCAHDF